MKPIDCEFEADVLAAVVQGRWPERADGSLRRHASSCVICSDVAAIAGAFDLARQETNAGTALPDASRVWWVAQLRARREAAVAAGRPITATQVFAFAWALGLLGVCLGIAFDWFQSSGSRLTTNFDANAVLVSIAALVIAHGGLVLGSAALALLLPAAAYFAMGKD